MIPEERSLPLFPLNTVLFPGATMPLQIFEERYRRMLQDCLNEDSRLGIVLIKEGKEVGETATPHAVGTIAQIIQVKEVETSGRYFISITGENRFIIKDIIKQEPYLTAVVEILQESEDAVPPQLLTDLENTLDQYRSLLVGLDGGWSRKSKPIEPTDTATLSYRVGDLLQMTLSQKQALLEESSAPVRIGSELKLLHKDIETLKREVSQEFLRKFSSHCY